jgi:hypothetical protein
MSYRRTQHRTDAPHENRSNNVLADHERFPRVFSKKSKHQTVIEQYTELAPRDRTAVDFNISLLNKISLGTKGFYQETREEVRSSERTTTLNGRVTIDGNTGAITRFGSSTLQPGEFVVGVSKMLDGPVPSYEIRQIEDGPPMSALGAHALQLATQLAPIRATDGRKVA